MLVTQVPAFRRFWHPLAFADDLDAGPLQRTLLGESLVLWATGPGTAAAAYDKCPHRAAPLSAGWASEGCIVCPYHGWVYGGDGVAVHIPQLDEGVPMPPKARLRTVHCEVRHGVVWVALEEPVTPIPDVPGSGEDGYRWIRQFDETWAAAAPRLVDNSFDPAHVAYVHRKTFGEPAKARIDTPQVERTPTGMVIRAEIEVENRSDEARVSTGSDAPTTIRAVESVLVAPFSRVMTTRYPSGVVHTLFTGVTPVDDSHLRLVQFAVRNDTEEDAPAETIVAFDRMVTEEDQWLLESLDPDYEVDLADQVHIRVDRGTVEVRRIYQEIMDGTWPPLSRG